jgi:hypothetical protein
MGMNRDIAHLISGMIRRPKSHVLLCWQRKLILMSHHVKSLANLMCDIMRGTPDWYESWHRPSYFSRRRGKGSVSQVSLPYSSYFRNDATSKPKSTRRRRTRLTNVDVMSHQTNLMSDVMMSTHQVLPSGRVILTCWLTKAVYISVPRWLPKWTLETMSSTLALALCK